MKTVAEIEAVVLVLKMCLLTSETEDPEGHLIDFTNDSILTAIGYLNTYLDRLTKVTTE